MQSSWLVPSSDTRSCSSGGSVLCRAGPPRARPPPLTGQTPYLPPSSAAQGGTCGFGTRGQKARSGSGTRPGFEGGQMPLYRRLPKLRGIAGGAQPDRSLLSLPL